ncbi:hypothetical protein F0562_020197 [Nyssa sinensis]|uniref:Spindle assembly checkpoint component MAD1 n=1 Tax=Nyssa sinensis TaxID=561372 RepID=A0A5J5BQH1_9ASTE|nr:hypothetical protein F0562_020197 [Nyssa sinensis]
MILRTPPPRKRRADSGAPESPNSDRRLVIYEDPTMPESSHDHSEQMLCTYQCRQMVKSEFFDALSSAEKQARDYQSRLEALNNDFCKAEAERKKFRDQFLYAEQELAAAKGREQALQEQLSKEVDDSQERLKKQIQSYSELEVKLKHEMTQILKKWNAELIMPRKNPKLLKEQLEELQKQLKECLQQKSEVDKKLSSFMCQEVPSTDTNILVKHLQEELRNYESEVREARKFKSSHENIELLKEKLLEEKGRRERAEADLLKLSDVQLNMKKLEDELSAWKLMMKDIPGVLCADDIPLKFAALQKEVLESMMKLGEANARLKQVEVALDSAELGKQNAETEAALAKENAEVSKSEVKRVGSILSSVTEERDRLKYAVNELKKHNNVEVAGEMVNGTLVQELESSLAKKECCIKELESNLCELKEVNCRQHNEIKLLTERLNNEARRIKSLEREGDRLRSEISLLESKLGHGDFSSTNTKVLRMVNTLAVDNEAKQTIEALQSELQKTKEKLEAVEELKKQSGDTGKLVDSYISGKIVQLKEQIATLEKREERYKTVFADRISVFRRACCELFGFKIVMDDHQRSDGIPVTRFTLQSIYAQSDDEKLEFEYESGNTSILANNYTSQPEISHQVEIFIRKLNSIPAFTANLTVESFNKRTLS